MSNGETESEGPRSSPFPGCLILSAIVIVFGGLAVLYAVVGVYQTRAIDGFTQEQPLEVPLPEPAPEVARGAVEKLKRVESAVAAGGAERILFEPGDLNALLATLEPLADFRGTTRIERISPQGLVVKMSQPMRKGILDKGARYLNGDFVLQPELRARTIAFRVIDIRPVEGEAPEGFVKNYATLDFFRLDPDIEEIKANIGSIGAVYTEGGNLVVETKVGGADKTE